MNAKVLMFQGTGSDVGKSTLVAGLCRLAKRRDINVAPFKPQNMSNNAAACKNGGEIGRAQALQALACGLELHTDFNPVLLKPQSDRSAQVVVHGKVRNTVTASSYMNKQRADLMRAVLTSFQRLAGQYELVLVEGAGSPAEINLRNHDIANMGFARAVDSPVCLIGDIDRGGVIAAIAGTRQVIDVDDAKLITSFIINRFRGDPDLFTDGVSAIERITSWPCRGVVPWMPCALRLPQEDAVALDSQSDQIAEGDSAKIIIAVPMLSRIANFDDMDPLKIEAQVSVIFVPPGQHIPSDANAIIIPGTKSTIADLRFIKEQGWHHDIIAAARRGAKVLGLCGGYQILGKQVLDPDGVEGDVRMADGLGLLDVSTTMQAEKRTGETEATCSRSQSALSGYEIHIGTTSGKDTERPFLRRQTPASSLAGDHDLHDGAVSLDGQIEGTYLHGLFNNDEFRRWWLESLVPGTSSDLQFDGYINQQLDLVANELEATLDVDALFADAATARLPNNEP